jgi:hypothetical protein
MSSLIARIRAALCRWLCGQAAPPVCSNADGALTDASFVFVTAPTSGTRVQSGVVVNGCSRTFESNVPWRLVDRQGNELASGSALGGGVDGFASFSFNVTFTVATRQIGHLEIGDEDVSGGEGFPPVRNVIPLVLNP